MRQTTLGMPVQLCVLDRREDQLLEPVPQPGEPRALLGHRLSAELCRQPEPDRERDRDRPGAEAALVPAPVDERPEAHPRVLAAHVESADALRPVEEVRGRREEVHPHGLHVDRDLADRLGGVRVKQDPPVLREAAERGDRLDRSDLVVGEHDRDEDRPVRERRADRGDVDQAVGPHRHVRDPEPLPLEAPGDVEAGALLDDRGDEVVPLVAVCVGDALEREIDRLRAARREDDLPRIAGADEPGELLARPLHRALRLPAVRVGAAGRMAEPLGEVGEHRGQHARVDRRRRLRVHEDREPQGHRSALPGDVGRRSRRSASGPDPADRRGRTRGL